MKKAKCVSRIKDTNELVDKLMCLPEERREEVRKLVEKYAKDTELELSQSVVANVEAVVYRSPDSVRLTTKLKQKRRKASQAIWDFGLPKDEYTYDERLATLSTMVVNLEDEALRQALIVLGWTPPENGKK